MWITSCIHTLRSTILYCPMTFFHFQLYIFLEIFWKFFELPATFLLSCCRRKYKGEMQLVRSSNPKLITLRGSLQSFVINPAGNSSPQGMFKMSTRALGTKRNPSALCRGVNTKNLVEILQSGNPPRSTKRTKIAGISSSSFFFVVHFSISFFFLQCLPFGTFAISLCFFF